MRRFTGGIKIAVVIPLEAVRESTGIEERAGLTELSEEAEWPKCVVHVYGVPYGAFPIR